MIELLLLAVTGFGVAWTGPAFDERRDRRRRRREFPHARVVPLVACKKCLRVGCPYHL